ncbi:MAG: diaminopimelate decarboxylase [Betaproteobacteria bacterium]|nr:diaminopimelate decarboxylase [Betaproteobacteria bacterium]
MDFSYRNGALCAEQVPLEEIARRFGTPCFVYSRAGIERQYRAYTQAFEGRKALVAYSVKANSNLAVLALMARLGAGFDIVSGGELARVLAAGGDPRKVLFSGIGKSEIEIEQALRAGIMCLNVESEAELERVDGVAKRIGKRAPIALRINPDIDAKTHPYISTGLRQSKFGVPIADAERLYLEAARRPHLEPIGIGCHIGSLLADPAPWIAAAERVVELADRIERGGVTLTHIDVGGGIGIRYRDEVERPVGDFIAGALRALGARRHTLIVDPGRSIVGNAGVLVTRVEYVKPGDTKNFLVVDVAMNDLLRPALYGAWHEVRPIRERQPGAPEMVYDIVGPVCESADVLARDRALAARPGDLLALMSAGAYGMSMSSNYNTRARAAEVLADGAKAHLVRRRESIEELYTGEIVPPW